MDLTDNKVLWAQIYVGFHGFYDLGSFDDGSPVVHLQHAGFGVGHGAADAVDQQGKPRRGFPVRFNEIRMGVVCADVANDAYLEIVGIL